jgi:hypothetical protein
MFNVTIFNFRLKTNLITKCQEQMFQDKSVAVSDTPRDECLLTIEVYKRDISVFISKSLSHVQYLKIYFERKCCEFG